MKTKNNAYIIYILYIYLSYKIDIKFLKVKDTFLDNKYVLTVMMYNFVLFHAEKVKLMYVHVYIM